MCAHLCYKWDIVRYIGLYVKLWDLWEGSICKAMPRGKPAWDLDITACGYVSVVRIYVNSISMEHIVARRKYIARYIADNNINIFVNECTLISNDITL